MLNVLGDQERTTRTQGVRTNRKVATEGIQVLQRMQAHIQPPFHGSKPEIQRWQEQSRPGALKTKGPREAGLEEGKELRSPSGRARLWKPRGSEQKTKQHPELPSPEFVPISIARDHGASEKDHLVT